MPKKIISIEIIDKEECCGPPMFIEHTVQIGKEIFLNQGEIEITFEW